MTNQQAAINNPEAEVDRKRLGAWHNNYNGTCSHDRLDVNDVAAKINILYV